MATFGGIKGCRRVLPRKVRSQRAKRKYGIGIQGVFQREEKIEIVETHHVRAEKSALL